MNDAVEIEAETPMPSPWRQGTMVLHDTTFGIWEEHVDDGALTRVMRSYLSRMRTRGWKVVRDAEADKHYKIISDNFRNASKGELRAHIQLSGRHFEILIYQDKHNVENPNGGRYDFDKFERMPRPMQSLAVVELAALVGKGLELGYTVDDRVKIDPAHMLLDVKRIMSDPNRSKRSPLDKWRDGWGKSWCRSPKDVDERGWPMPHVYAYCGKPCLDRDGVPIECGDVRYFREKGRLYRGVCWPNMNGNWLVYYGGGPHDWGYAVKHNNELFQCERPDLEPRRAFHDHRARVQKILAAAVKAEQWGRVATLGKVLERHDRHLAALEEGSRRC